MKLMIALCCIAVSGCCYPKPKPEVSPLVVSSCPEIQAPADETFGATTYTLIQQAGQYRKCRGAALGVK